MQRVTYFVECITEDQSLALQERQSQLEAQRLKHELQRESLRREMKFEREALTTQAADYEAQRANDFEQSVRTQLGLDIDYKIDIGKPQIDVVRMKAAITKHEQALQEHEKIVSLVRQHNQRVSGLRTEAVEFAISNGNGSKAVELVSWWNNGCEAPQPADSPTCALPAGPQPPTEGQIDEPESPMLDDLAINVPISISLSGNGRVRDSSTRRIRKDEPKPEGQTERCNPRDPSCEAPCPRNCRVKCSPECKAPHAAHFEKPPQAPESENGTTAAPNDNLKAVLRSNGNVVRRIQ